MHIVKTYIFLNLQYSDCAYQLCTVYASPRHPHGSPPPAPTPLQTFLPRAHCSSIFVWSIYLINLLWERLSAIAPNTSSSICTHSIHSPMFVWPALSTTITPNTGLFLGRLLFTLSLIHVALQGKWFKLSVRKLSSHLLNPPPPPPPV